MLWAKFLHERIDVLDGSFFFIFNQDSLFPEVRLNASNKTKILKPSAQKLAFVTNSVPVINTCSSTIFSYVNM